ncbi:hypothetical protein EDC04DRAFT_2895313 [Pisolithus marmoratus]|nr:hypothetical protein EDC04DRAFT_2895313 [Pisolithus marmoratus]
MSTSQLAFPPLPQHNCGRWQADILAAHETLKKMYNQALFVLHFDGFLDPTQVSFHIDTLTSTVLPILEALIPGANHEDGHLPHEWVVGVARLTGQTVQDLWDMAQVINAFKQQEVCTPELVTEFRSG